MSRPIKFRAWDKDQERYLTATAPEIGNWIGLIFTHEKREFEIGYLQHGKNQQELFIVEQFTGLLDKKGVEIYEGDIVQGDSEFGESTGTVTYETVFAGWAIGDTRMSAFRLGTCKVIGNRWENRSYSND